MADGKSPDAFRTIGELSAELGVAQHILRYWETKFPQLKPLQRAGNRRYYRADDVALARRINRLLGEEGYTVRGVQKLLGDKAAVDEPAAAAPAPEARPVESFTFPSDVAPQAEPVAPSIDIDALAALRDRLVSALRS